jgi:hypothetical protein
MGALCSRPTRDLQRVGRLDSHGEQKQLGSLLAGWLGGAARDMHMCPKCNVPRAWWHVLQPKSRDTDLHTLHKFHRFRCTSTPRGCGQCDYAVRVAFGFNSRACCLAAWLAIQRCECVPATISPHTTYSVITTNNTHSLPPACFLPSHLFPSRQLPTFSLQLVSNTRPASIAVSRHTRSRTQLCLLTTRPGAWLPTRRGRLRT